MKIELKKIKFSEAMSEETNAFTAELFINDKRIGYCKNDGHGGCTDYQANSPVLRTVIENAEAYCKSLPKVKYGDMERDNSLEDVIDQLLEDWLNAKEQKKMERKMQTGILWGKPNSSTYTYLNYKIPLEGLSKTAPRMLQERVDQIKAKYCTGGVVILNTNLEALGIQV